MTTYLPFGCFLHEEETTRYPKADGGQQVQKWIHAPKKKGKCASEKKIFYTRLVIAGLQLMTKVLCYVLLGARFHGYVEYGINEEIDHKHGRMCVFKLTLSSIIS